MMIVYKFYIYISFFSMYICIFGICSCLHLVLFEFVFLASSSALEVMGVSQSLRVQIETLLISP